MVTIITILIMLFLMAIVVFAWLICATGERDERDDEEQLHYINEWNKKNSV